jgi:hypothetical protein
MQLLPCSLAAAPCSLAALLALTGCSIGESSSSSSTGGGREGAAAACCAGSFVAEGRGGTYPPGSDGAAFDFIASNDNATYRFAQRAKDPAVQVGNVNLPPDAGGKGGGHWFWTNATNCVRIPNKQALPNLCFGAGHTFGVDRGTVTMAGVTVQRWSDGPASPHIFYTLRPSHRISLVP